MTYFVTDTQNIFLTRHNLCGSRRMAQSKGSYSGSNTPMKQNENGGVQRENNYIPPNKRRVTLFRDKSCF